MEIWEIWSIIYLDMVIDESNRYEHEVLLTSLHHDLKEEVMLRRCERRRGGRGGGAYKKEK